MLLPENKRNARVLALCALLVVWCIPEPYNLVRPPKLLASNKIWRRACSASRRFSKLRLRSCGAPRREPRPPNSHKQNAKHNTSVKWIAVIYIYMYMCSMFQETRIDTTVLTTQVYWLSSDCDGRLTPSKQHSSVGEENKCVLVCLKGLFDNMWNGRTEITPVFCCD